MSTTFKLSEDEIETLERALDYYLNALRESNAPFEGDPREYENLNLFAIKMEIFSVKALQEKILDTPRF